MKNLDSSSFVLDSGGFYSGLYLSTDFKYYTTSSIIMEIKHLLNSTTLDILISTQRLEVLDPTKDSMTTVKNAARISGDIKQLSYADLSIISLAYQLGFPLLSDDYAVQNVSKILSIKITPISMLGISKIRKWVNFCKTCGKGYPPTVKECQICGNRTSRRFKTKSVQSI